MLTLEQAVKERLEVAAVDNEKAEAEQATCN